MPKFSCWKVWLARNRSIFQQYIISPKANTAKGHGLLIETIWVKGVKGHNILMLEQDQQDCLKDVLLGDVSQPRSINSKPSHGVNRKIHLEEEEIKCQQLSQRKFILFFDRASKGNPGVASAREIVLGVALSLYQELKILDPRWTRNLISTRDSTIIIRLIRCSSTLSNSELARHILRIQKEANHFESKVFPCFKDQNR